jgi:hypothetical protein
MPNTQQCSNLCHSFPIPSAYYWRLLVTCNKDDPRKQTAADAKSLAVKYPNEWCKPRNEREQEKYDRYDSNPKLLVQQLCYRDSDGNLQLNKTSPAFQDMDNIRHLKRGHIEDWLGDSMQNKYYDWRTNVNRLYPVVLEKGFDLPFLVHEAISRSYHEFPEAYNNESATTFEKRQERALCASTAVDEETKATNQHTSGGGSFIKYSLSLEEEQCAALFYQTDYKLIRELREKACKSRTCINALTSILDRRASMIS